MKVKKIDVENFGFFTTFFALVLMLVAKPYSVWVYVAMIFFVGGIIIFSKSDKIKCFINKEKVEVLK